jgi:hypothetical protein
MKCFFLIFIFTFHFSFSQENHIEKVTFNCTKKINKTFLYKLIETKEGKDLDSLKIQNDIQILNRLNGVSKSTYKVISLENKTYEVVFDITENFSLIPTLSIWTTDQVGSYRFGIYEFNLLGKNNTLGGYYQYNGDHSFGVNFSSPQFFSARYGIGANFQKLTSIEPIFYNKTKALYRYTNTALEIIGNYQVDICNQVKFGFTFFNEKYNFLSGVSSPDLPQKLDLNKQLFKIQHSYDDLKYDFYIVKGFKSTFFFQYVISDKTFHNQFAIAWNDFLYFKSFGHNLNWASRLRLGLSSNKESPFSAFSVDNNLNIRGVGNIIDRGTGTIVFNTELRKTIFEKKWFVIQGNLFVDSGSWRNPGGSFSDFADSKNFRIYPGIGVRFIHKTIFNAVFRLDYGYGITKNASKGIVFGVGQYF